MNNDDRLFVDTTLPVRKEDTLKTTRLDMEELKSDMKIRKQLPNTSQDNQFQIKLVTTAREKPIIVRNLATITIGRSDRQRNAIPTVDLSEDNAQLLGVSRLHAKIIYVDGCYYIKDMASVNGTWVNGVRLTPYQIVPINQGDQIRLGQLVMTIG